METEEELKKQHAEALAQTIQKCGVSHHVVVYAEPAMHDAGIIKTLTEVRSILVAPQAYCAAVHIHHVCFACWQSEVLT